MRNRSITVLTRGTCRNARCETARVQTPVERYSGVGEYCPECGDLLQRIWPDEPAVVKPFFRPLIGGEQRVAQSRA